MEVPADQSPGFGIGVVGEILADPDEDFVGEVEEQWKWRRHLRISKKQKRKQQRCEELRNGCLSWDEEEEEAEAEERVVGGLGEGLDLTRTGISDPIHHCVFLLCSSYSLFVLVFLCSVRVEIMELFLQRGGLGLGKRKEGGIRYSRDYRFYDVAGDNWFGIFWSFEICKWSGTVSCSGIFYFNLRKLEIYVR